MLPKTDMEELSADTEFEEEKAPSLTFMLDKDNKKLLSAMVDGEDAYKQAIWMILKTEAMTYPIFGSYYGTMFDDLYGEDPDYVIAEIEQRIEDAILADDRFDSVDFTDVTVEKGNIHVEMTITTVDGDNIEMDEVIEANV